MINGKKKIIRVVLIIQGREINNNRYYDFKIVCKANSKFRYNKGMIHESINYTAPQDFEDAANPVA